MYQATHIEDIYGLPKKHATGITPVLNDRAPLRGAITRSEARFWAWVMVGYIQVGRGALKRVLTNRGRLWFVLKVKGPRYARI